MSNEENSTTVDTTEDMSGPIGLVLHGLVASVNVVVPIILWHYYYNNYRVHDTYEWATAGWDNTYWYNWAWNILVTVFPLTWGPFLVMWCGVALFNSPWAAWGLSYWIYVTFAGGVAGLLPFIF